MPGLGGYAAWLAQVLDPSRAGQQPLFGPLELGRVDDLDLGTLFARCHRARAAGEPSTSVDRVCSAVRQEASHRSPVFTPQACRELFLALAAQVEQAGAEDGPLPWGPLQRLAAQAMARCPDGLPPGLADAATALLSTRDRPRSQGQDRWIRLALAWVAGPDVEAQVIAELRVALVSDPLALAELELLPELDGVGRAVLVEADRFRSGELAGLPDGIDRLVGADGYPGFARTILEAARARVVDVQAGRVPYAADTAFTVAEADVLWRCAQVALLRDEPWAGELLHILLPGVVVAPTPARTAPSQAAATVLAQAVDAWPTPEALEALREARRVVRHAGLAKKLDRILRSATKALAERPTVALRLPAKGAPTKAQLATVLRALEGGYPLDVRYPWEQWRAELAGHPSLGAIVGSLVWEVRTGDGGWSAGLPGAVEGRSGPWLLDVTGTPMPAPDNAAAVRLWHPVRATAVERAAWRDRITALQLVQPVRQVFREHYRVDTDGTDFAGHVVAVRPLLGLAVREGWRIDHGDGVLHRDLGNWRVVLAITGDLYPGAAGFGDVRTVTFQHRDGGAWRPAGFAQAPSVLVSEALRAVDLLVSVSSFGLDDDLELHRDTRRWHLLANIVDRDLGHTARMRREALCRILPDDLAGQSITMGDRHVRVGPYAVHLATARVTRDGEPVTVPVPDRASTAAVPWLPYDERLLERIAHAVVHLATVTGPGPVAEPR